VSYYPLDPSLPFSIIDHDLHTHTYTVLGTAKTILSKKWVGKTVELGGHKSIFTVKKNEFLTEPQKRQLRWVKRKLGDRQHDKLEKELCDFVVASHWYNNT
jgi:hypothetical protein